MCPFISFLLIPVNIAPDAVSRAQTVLSGGIYAPDSSNLIAAVCAALKTASVFNLFHLLSASNIMELLRYKPQQFKAGYHIVSERISIHIYITARKLSTIPADMITDVRSDSEIHKHFPAVIALTEVKGSGNFQIRCDLSVSAVCSSVTDLIIINRDPSFQGVE